MKADLHRHVGGSINPTLISELLNISLDEVKNRYIFCQNDIRDFYVFLSKFSILDEIIWNDKNLLKAFQQIIWDAAREKLDYLELKFSLDRYIEDSKMSASELIKFINDIVKYECDKWGLQVGLVLSLKYEKDRNRQRRMSKIIESESAQYLCGIDLVGDEACLDVDFYKPIFREWKEEGKGCMAHAGESRPGSNVGKVIEALNVDRVAHGIKIIDDQYSLDLAKERGICFDVALTSNIATGIVKDIKDHPVIQMLQNDLIITIGTDDPTVFGVTLDMEYQKLMDIGVSKNKVFEIMQNSIAHSFVDLGE